MFKKVKEDLTEVIALADSCPEKYQLKCFEVLLEALVRSESVAAGGPAVAVASGALTPQVGVLPKVLTQQGISQEELAQVFHWDGGSYNIIVGDLKVKPMAHKQVRLALLLGMKSLLETGSDPIVPKDALVDLCKKYSAYDSPNFASNMKKNKQFFLVKGNDWVLPVPGQREAAKVIKELAQ